MIQLLDAMTDETNRRRETSSRNNSFSSPHNTLTEQQLQSNYKSAFEITSVSDVPPDGEEEGVAARDGEDAKPGVPELGRIEENNGRLRSGSTSLPELQGEPTVVPSQLSSHSQTDFPDLSGGARPLNASAAVGNGPSQTGQSRFRRVNHYTRGRWTIRDTHEPEERPDSDTKISQQATIATATRTPSDLTYVSTSSSPAAVRKGPAEWDQHSRSGSDLSHVNEQVAKDHSIDQSSTTVDSHTLSRNASLSSLLGQTAEKDERMEDFDQDCTTTISFKVDICTQTVLEDQQRHSVCPVCLQRLVYCRARHVRCLRT